VNYKSRPAKYELIKDAYVKNPSPAL